MKYCDFELCNEPEENSLTMELPVVLFAWSSSGVSLVNYQILNYVMNLRKFVNYRMESDDEMTLKFPIAPQFSTM